MINYHICVYGKFDNNTLCDNMSTTEVFENFDMHHRWRLVDKLSEEYTSDALIFNLNKFQLDEIIQLEQEIRGYGKIIARNDSILGKLQYAIVIRTSLFPHYFSDGTTSCLVDDFLKDIEKNKSILYDSLHALGLSIGQIVVTTDVDISQFDKITSLYQKTTFTYEDIDSARIFYDNLNEFETYVILNKNDSKKQMNDIILYGNWQVLETINYIKNYGIDIVKESTAISQTVKSVTSGKINNKSISSISNYRKELLDIETKYLDFYEMINTMISFRNYQLNPILQMLSEKKDSKILDDVFIKRFNEGNAILERTKNMSKSFITKITNQLSTVESIYQTLHNIKLQKFMNIIEITGIIFAILSLGTGMVSMIVDIMNFICGGI